MQPWPATDSKSAVSPAVMRWLSIAILTIVSPPAVLSAASAVSGLSISEILREAAFGWDVGGVYTPVVVWCVWWPAWLCGQVIVLGKPREEKAKVA
jgi:glycosylphosphatidylinositol transamidase